MNIAGLVLNEKIKDPKLKQALINSSMALGYQFLVQNKVEISQEIQDKYNPNTIIKQLSDVEIKMNRNDINYLATLVYIYYAKGELSQKNKDKINAYEQAITNYQQLESEFKSKFKNSLRLFTHDYNILYNGNANIVASVYGRLNELDSKNTAYHEDFKKHLLNELDYLMKENRWQDADRKNDQFLLVSAKKEKQGFLELNDIKNFNCKDLKEVDDLWVKNSGGKFGFSVQNRIWKETGNSLDLEKWSNEGYNRFGERVGWKKGKEERGRWMRYSELPLWEYKNLGTYKLMGTLPFHTRVLSYSDTDTFWLLSDKSDDTFFSFLLAETCRL
ncbi:GUN4 domain-containing protein [Anabaena sp. UHCC 0253]|uniref:GUN4 domain-containing protein n=1 Tax=Anabaena sp. UHCC 0253 TaxID=2590019 RepID=UPI0014465EA3|nr:GUN4 domain-containing protein [Anabaena sp. UHCC 0253]MTJ54379.1 GUN4 domain-containing protein [Anabaena sp. UHCC 0253]